MGSSKEDALERLKKKIEKAKIIIALVRKYPELFRADDQVALVAMQRNMFTEEEQALIRKFSGKLNPKLDVNSRESLLKHASYMFALHASCRVGTYGDTSKGVKQQLEMEFTRLNDAYTAVFNEAMQVSKTKEKPWVLLREIAMLRRIRLENQTREQEARINEYSRILKDNYGHVLKPQDIQKYEVLEALFVDQDLRSAYIAHYNTPVKTGEARDEYVAASIEELSQFVKEQKKSSMQLIAEKSPDQLRKLLNDYQQQIMKFESQLYKSTTNLNDLYEQRFNLALKYELCKEIEILIVMKESPEFKEFYDKLAQKMQEYREKYSKMGDEKLLRKLDKYTEIAKKDISFTQPGTKENRDIVLARFLVKEINEILTKERKRVGESNVLEADKAAGKPNTHSGRP